MKKLKRNKNKTREKIDNMMSKKSKPKEGDTFKNINETKLDKNDHFDKIYESVLEDTANLDIECEEIQNDIPNPIVQPHLEKEKSNQKKVLHKLKSEEDTLVPLIPIKDLKEHKNNIEKIEESKSSKSNKSSKEMDSLKSNSTPKEGSAISKIKAIKRERAKRDSKTTDNISRDIDQASLTLDSNTNSEHNNIDNKNTTKDDKYEDEEEKVLDMSKSKGSSNTDDVYLEMQDDDEYISDFDAFGYRDKYFDENFIGLSRQQTNLDEIKEDDELDDEFDGSEQRQLEKSIKDTQDEINERRKALEEMAGEKLANEWYEYFKRNYDEDDESGQLRMEDVHIFFKRKGVKDYKEMVLECFRLNNAYKTLESQKRHLKEYEKYEEYEELSN